MEKGLVFGIVLVFTLSFIPLVFGEDDITIYDRGIEYEICRQIDDQINCVKCRDTDGGRDYYVKGEATERHMNYFERGALGSGGPAIIDKCEETIPLLGCSGTIIKEATNDNYGLCELYSWKIMLYEKTSSSSERRECEGIATEEEFEGVDSIVCRVDDNIISVSRPMTGNIIQGNGTSIASADGTTQEYRIARGERITILVEGYCEQVGEYQEYKAEEYECPNGCEDGACIRDDGCPSVIGWRIEGIKCLVDSGCNYDSSYDYYDSAEDCIDGLGKVEYPVLAPLPVPDTCHDLLIEENIGTYNYRKTTYSRMGPDVYSADGQKIRSSQCCLADYKKNLLDLAGSVVYICPLDNRANVENTMAHVAGENTYELGEYATQKVYWMRNNDNEALLWTNNINILAVADASGAIPDDIAKAYLEKHNSDLGVVDLEITTNVITEPTSEPEPEAIGEPIDIPENNLFYSCTGGCEFQGKCYPLGYREGKQYCSDNNQLIGQSKKGVCENDFECKSNVCDSGECISEGLMEKIGNWFKKVFGGEQE